MDRKGLAAGESLRAFPLARTLVRSDKESHNTRTAFYTKLDILQQHAGSGTHKVPNPPLLAPSINDTVSPAARAF
jgi:hypothetical protein